MHDARPNPFSDKSVLFVEDDPETCSLLELVLGDIGFSVVQGTNRVGEALDLVQRFRPDVALLDVQLGSESGLVLAEVLGGAGIPFAFATGAPDHVLAAWRDVPRLRKPYTGSDIAETLLALLQGSAGGRVRRGRRSFSAKRLTGRKRSSRASRQAPRAFPL